jgi:hypothetical protein
VAAALVVLDLMTGCGPAVAEQVILAIDPIQSTPTWSGTDNTTAIIVGGVVWGQSFDGLPAVVSGHFPVAFER